jgi:hypothetical protein
VISWTPTQNRKPNRTVFLRREAFAAPEDVGGEDGEREHEDDPDTVGREEEEKWSGVLIAIELSRKDSRPLCFPIRAPTPLFEIFS